ncbi:TIGR03759 family integrating conjugative element protein [Gilvimarinus sp. SDUM040013]|uniref:TIGR03759 family integrating conjugative element protein n=1 Tax=Gilvimarinus gilvus TaxID=3058038 RepID=A0ABU4S245_9GAMM|nr:TIGR03759 family integrating conjugative element protein [Gilvimarinus sp. SDUM040013]MDO3387999.1 TIGR03759 family integrating conjugative element protein [Gilvimarinus sp. SDUM040013]MDX6851220.1 TIGR03759 family integrating conjugative element protein [Gilvimarinus sp. SDUM040013]
MITRVFAILVLLGTACLCQAAQTEINDTQRTDSLTGRTQAVKPWLRWGLTESEWATYQDIMQGPRGIWTPNISPVSALGLNAQSEVERTRYAKIAARQDWQRLMNERAWHLAYKSAKEEYFGQQIAMIDVESASISNITANSKLVMFTDENCIQVCQKTLESVIQNKASLDIYFIGKIERDDIIQWAATHAIPPELVNDAGKITLNIDRGLFQAMSPSSGDLPQIYVRDPRMDGELMEVEF